MQALQRGVLWLAGLGFLLGLGGLAFYQGRGWSYLSDRPEACANCHIMRDQYESWWHSSHRNWAGCNDCHMPHTFLGKWTTKALSGFQHSLAFTTGDFPEPIVITPATRPSPWKTAWPATARWWRRCSSGQGSTALRT